MLLDDIPKRVECAGYDIRIRSVGFDNRDERRYGLRAKVCDSVNRSPSGADCARECVYACRITKGDHKFDEFETKLSIELITNRLARARTT